MLYRIFLSMLISLSMLTSANAFAEEKPADTDNTAKDVSSADKPADDKTTDISTNDQSDKKSDTIEVRDAGGFFEDSFGNMPDEIKTAKDDGKEGLLIMFEMDECPFCHRMKATVLNRSDIQDYFKEHFRIISVDVEGDLEMTDFQGKSITQKDFALKEFRVRATPVFQFIGLDGKPIKNGRLTGATKDASEFMLFGKYIAEKKNEDTPFIKYKMEVEDSTTAKSDDAKG